MPESPFGSGGRGRGRSPFGGGRPVSISPEMAEEYYAALLGRSNVETDTPKGLFDRIWSNPITEGLAGLIPGGPIAKGLANEQVKAAGLVEEGEDNPIYGPASGAMNRIFDILSRGQYASAGVTQELMGDREGDSSLLGQLESIWRTGAAIPAQALPGWAADLVTEGQPDYSDAAAAGIRGLAGREKKSYAQVLESQGVENPVLQHSAGFGLDVALDPTTFLGLGKASEGSRLQKITEALRGDNIAPHIDDAGKADIITRPKELGPGEVIEAEILDADWYADHRGLPVADETFEVNMPPGGIRSSFRVGPDGLIDEVKGVERTIFNSDGTYSRKRFDYDPQWTIGREIELAEKPGLRVIVPDLRDPLPTSEIYDPFRMFDEVKELNPSSLGPDDFKLGPIEVGHVPGTKKIEIRRAEDFARQLQEIAQKQTKPQKRLPRQKGTLDPNKRLIQMGPVGSTGLDIIDDAPIQAAPAKPAVTRKAPEWVSEGAYRMILQDRPPRPPRALGPGKGPLAALPPGNTLGELVEGLGRTTQETTRRGPIKVGGERHLPATVTKQTGRPPYSSSIQPPKSNVPARVANQLDTVTDDTTGFKFSEDFDPGSNKTGPVDPKTGEASELFPKDTRGYLSINLLGTPILRSYKAYSMGKKYFNGVLFNGAGEARMLYKMFSNNAVLPDGLDQLVRAKESARLDEMDARVNGVVETLKHIPEEERKMMSFAIDEGTNLETFLAPPSLADRGFETLEDVRQWVKGIFENLDAAERAQGVSTGPRASDYFYKVNKKGKPVKDDLSLQQLIDKGEEVETDVLQSVLHRIARTEARLTRSDMWIEAADRFALSKSQVTPEQMKKFGLVEVPGFPDRVMPREYVDALNHSDKLFQSDEYASKIMDIADNALKEWKFLATAANPGHHIRNFISDIIMNAQAGVLGTSAYRKAARVYRASGNLQLADELVAPGTYDYVPGQTVPRVFKETDSGANRVVRIGKHDVPLQDVWNAYVESGGKSSFQQTELHRTSERVAKTGAYSAFRKKAGDFAQGREDYVRLANFIDAMDKSAKRKPIYKNGNWTQEGRDAIRTAGERVRKWNLDYGSLTPFERRYMKRLIPFYSFMRLNIPRQIELLATKPGFMALYPKGQNLIQGVLGTDEADDTLLPDWIRESAPFRLQKHLQEQKGPMGWLLNQFGVEPGQQAVLGGTGLLPIGDLERLQPLFAPNPVEQTANQGLSMLNPIAKVPIELGMNKNAFTGQEIGTGFDDYVKYAAGQLPASRQAAGGYENGGFARYLTGLPIRGVTEGQMKGEFRRREDIINGVFNKEMGEATQSNPTLALLPEEERRRFFRLMQGLNTGG